MARYDKYDPKAGGFRALLAAAWGEAEGLATPFAVGLDANGRVVKGAGNSGVVGVLVIDHAKPAGDAVDVMTNGEIVEVAGLTAGTEYFAGADGVIDTTNTDTKVGFTAEASRLIVRTVGQLGA